MYICTVTADDAIESVRDFDEPSAARLLELALTDDTRFTPVVGDRFTMTVDPATATITLTRPGCTITLTPATPLAPITRAQRRALFSLAVTPRESLGWGRGNHGRGRPRLEYGRAAHLSWQASDSLTAAGYVTRFPDPPRITLRGWLAVGRIYRDGATIAAVLRSLYATPQHA